MIDNYKERKRANQQITQTNPPMQGKVTEVHSDGSYDVTLPDGTVYSRVQNQLNIRWNTDQWVTMEVAGGNYAIGGRSSTRASD